MNKSKWILLAEDDASMAELTTLALAPDELACQVIVARDGLEALDCLHRRGGFQSRPGGNPVFVLLDLKMPKVDGLEVLRQIKSDARFKHIPVVMFSSSRELSDVRRSYQLGANGYVVKPADFRKFNEALERVGQFWVMSNELPPEAESVEAKGRDHTQLAAVV
jgi:CheY-like chemotaxis protein